MAQGLVDGAYEVRRLKDHIAVAHFHLKPEIVEELLAVETMNFIGLRFSTELFSIVSWLNYGCICLMASF